MASFFLASLVSEQPTPFSFRLLANDFDSIGPEYEISEDGIDCSGTIHRLGNAIKLKGHYSAAWSKECDRCLTKAQRTTEGNFDLVLAPLDQFRDDQNMNQEFYLDDVELDFYSGEKIQLAQYFESQFILDADLIFLCSENCLGLCSVCGANKNNTSCNCEDAQKNRPFSILSSINKKS